MKGALPINGECPETIYEHERTHFPTQADLSFLIRRSNPVPRAISARNCRNRVSKLQHGFDLGSGVANEHL